MVKNNYPKIYDKCNFSVVEMVIRTQKKTRVLTLEKIFSTICFIAGVAFLIAALFGLWRHFFTMGLCFAVGVMISEDHHKPELSKKRHEEK